MTKKKSLIIILITLVLLITACRPIDVEDVSNDTGEDEPVTGEIVEGGEITIPLTNFNTLNPLLTTNLNYHFFSKLIFESLFDFDEDLSVVPRLAQEYTIYDEGKTILVELKNNIKWHDGAQFTAEDVAFTIEVIKAAGSEGTYGKMIESSLGIEGSINYNSVIKTTILDDYRIEIHFDNIYLNNLEVLTFPIIPKHVFSEARGTKQDINRALQIEDYQPIGTGPYRFDIYEKHKSIRLVRNQDYWNGNPQIEGITGRILDDDESILVAFETGQVNLAASLGTDWDKYKQNKRIRVAEFTSPSFEFLGFNFDNGFIAGEKGQEIRKAISYGIDRQDIIHKVYLGHGIQIDVPLHPDSYLVSDHAYSYGYNKDLAIKILREAGFDDGDDDGILEDEEGNKLSFRLLTNANNQTRVIVAEEIKEDLGDIGIEITLDFDTHYIRDYDEAEDEIIWEQFNNRLVRGDFDIVLLGWQASVIPNLSSMFHSSMIAQGTNFINYINDRMDQVLLDSLIGSPRERKESIYERLQGLIVEDIPYVSLYYINRALLIDTKIQGDLNPTFFNIYNGLEKCYIVE